MNRKGVVLILSFFVIVSLTVLAGVVLTKSINENNLVKRHVKSIQAFWLTEEGIAQGLRDLPSTANVNGCLSQARGCLQGDTCCYTASISQLTSAYYQIDSVGTVTLGTGGTVSKSLSIIARAELPSSSNFPHAVEVTGELIIKGQAYTINGTVNEGAALSFSDLFEQSKEEVRSMADNLYEDTLAESISGITWVDVSSGGELAVSGDLQGDGILVISGDAHFSGTVDFDGIIYIIGKLRMSGTPTINGSVFAESETDVDTTISGHVTLNHSSEAISGALVYLQGVTAEIVSWRQFQ
ncbi:MAG: hypothetical protein ABIH08_02730 [Candidatus Omnitrophota bacterium]